MDTVELDHVRVANFFNGLELNEDDVEDIDLLVEAERRGLLNEACALLLDEARDRGFVPHRTVDESRSFEVKYLGMTHIVTDNIYPTSDEMAEALSAVISHGHGQPGSLEVFNDSIQLFLGTTTPQTLLSRQREHRLMLSKLQAKCYFDRHVCLAMTNAASELLCFVYKSRSKKSAAEIVHLISQSCQELSEVRKWRGMTEEYQARIRVAPTRRVKLSRGSAGFGFFFIGAKKDGDAPGIYVSKIQAGSAADHDPDISVGTEIVAINSKVVSDSTMFEVRDILQQTGDTVNLILRDNPVGFSFYESSLLHERPSLNFQGPQTTQEREDQLDACLAELRNLSGDLSYVSPVRVVAGKAHIPRAADSWRKPKLVPTSATAAQ